MHRFSRSQELQTLSEINVTPMLDLCLVLLIIFMITTPLLENSMELTIPTSTTASQAVDLDRVNVISIDRNAMIQLDGTTLTLEELGKKLEALKQQKADALSVVIRAHHELPVQKFVSLMDVLQHLHITKVGVVTQNDAENGKQ